MTSMASKVYDELNKAWKSTCRILLGDEIGDLKDYEAWLREYFPKAHARKSHVSGSEVTVVMDDYCNDANFVSMNEAKEKSIDPLTINEIKDVDSVLEAISEKWEYTGNRMLGNSSYVEKSDLIIDSQYVYDSVNLEKSAYAYATFEAVDFKYSFGSGYFSKDCEFLIKFLRGSNDKRCFSSVYSNDCSDIYSSMHCYGSHDLMFCFHQWNKRNCIGNVQLTPDKYRQLKAKLLGEMRDTLKKSKSFPSLFELIPNEPLSGDVRISSAQEKKEENLAPIDKSFKATFKVIFKKEASSLEDYEEWLSKRVVPVEEFVSPFGAKVYKPRQNATCWILASFPDKRLVTYAEALELGKLQMKEEDLSNLEKIKEWVAKTGTFATEFLTGTHMNIIKTPVALDSSNTYNVYTGVRSEYCGVSSWPIQSKHVFGCRWVTDTQHSIKCYNSLGLMRCFEVDTSTRCTDSFFAHNCEGLSEAMFCWNAKGKRYAIGNTMLPPEQYRKIKDALIGQIGDEIVAKKDFKWDIFNIGCAKK